MEPKLVDFSVIKQKIIKTDEVLQMYMENNKRLKKTQQAYKDLKSKYEEASSGLNRFQLESDRCSFTLEHITSKHDKLESEYKHLEQQNKSLEQKYCKHMIDYQTTIQDLQNELRMMKELNESAKLLSSPKKKTPSKDDESPKKIKELEEAAKKLKQNEARFKQDNDKLLLERKELVEDMKKMRNEHSKIVHILQEEKSKLGIDLNELKSQIASKQTHYNDAVFVRDKEISKLKAEVLALRGLKEQLKYLKEENKKLNNDINCQKQKLIPSRAAQTQTIQDIKSVLEENTLLKTEIKMYKCRTSKCEATQTESDEECESFEELFKEMTMLPRMLSPLPEEPLITRTKSSLQSEDKYSASKDYTKEKPDPGVTEDMSVFTAVVVQKVSPFVMKEECSGYVSDAVENYESKAEILICKENTDEVSVRSGLKTECFTIGNGIESELFAAYVDISTSEVEGRPYTKENPQLEAKITLPTADIDRSQGLSLSLADSKENLDLFDNSVEEPHIFENQSFIRKCDIKENSSPESELSSVENKNVPLFGGSVGDSQEFKNPPSIIGLKVAKNPHLEVESTLSKAKDQQNDGNALPSMDNKENLPRFDAPKCESQEIGSQTSKDDVDVKENPQLDGRSTISSADNVLCHRLGLFGHDEEELVGDALDFKNLPPIDIFNQKNLGIALPSMNNNENLPHFDAAQDESQQIENQSSIGDADIKQNPLDSKLTLFSADNHLCHRLGLLTVDNKERDSIGDSQGFKNQPLMNVSSIKENTLLEAESTLSTADSQQNHGIVLPHMDNKENLPLFEAELGESQGLENKPSKIENDIREESELVASGSGDKKSPRGRKYRLCSKVSDSTRAGFRGHPPTRKQMFRREMRMRKCRRVDSVLRALQVLKRSKINFTISNESTLPVHWKDPNWLDRFSDAPVDFGQPSRRMRVKNPARSGRTNAKHSTRNLSCASNACKSVSMSLESRCGTANLLGFFNVKQEAVSPLGEPLDKKPDCPLKWLNDSVHSDKAMESLLEKLAELVKEKLKNGKQSKRKRTVSPPSQDSEFCSETETELERLIEQPSYDVLERNKMLLKRAKYDLGRESTSVTSLEASDTKNSVETLADNRLKTERLDAAATTHQTCPLNPDKIHSSPTVVTDTAVRALWNKPGPNDKPSEVTAEVHKDIFETADSCDSYKFPTCPNLLSPLSSCPADSPRIRQFNLTPKKEDGEIDFRSPERKELTSICKLEQTSELLSPIRKIDELRKPRSPGCDTPKGRFLHPFEIKRENLVISIKTEASQLEMAMESTSATVETSDPGHLKVLEKTELEKLGCSGIEGLHRDGSPKKPNLVPNSQPSSDPSGSLENASPPTTHRSFQLLNTSNLRQYTNQSRNRKLSTNSIGSSKEIYKLSSFPVFADPKQTAALSLEVGPPDGKTTIEDFPLSLSCLDETDIFSVSSIKRIEQLSGTSGSFLDPLESRNESAELDNAGNMSASSCISDFLANETRITKEIEIFMTKFGMERSFAQATTLRNEQTSRNMFETSGKLIETGSVSKKISASDILNILPSSQEGYEEQEENEVPSRPLSPELQSAPVNFAPKVIPLEKHLVSHTPITDVLDTLPKSEEVLSSCEKQERKEVPSCPQSPELHSSPADFLPKVIPLERDVVRDTPITDTPVTDTQFTNILDIPPRSEEVVSYYEKQEEEEEAPTCPQSPEPDSDPVGFVPKVIPLERNLVTEISIKNTKITDTPITNTPITDAPITGIPLTDTPITDLPITYTPTTGTSRTYTSVTSTPRTYTLITSTPITDTTLTYTSVTDCPFNDPPITDTSVTDTSVTDTPITDAPITCTSITDTSVTYTSVTDTPITDAPITCTSITDTSVTYTSVTDTPITDAPITCTSITDTSVTYTSVTDYPFNDPPITDTSVTDTPITDAPITCPSITDTSVTDTSVTDTPITDAPITCPSITDTSVTDTSVTDTPITDAPITCTSISHTSVTDTSVTDNSVTYTPITDTPVTDTPVSDTPVTKQKVKGAIANTAVTKDKSKVAQRRSKRLSKAVISSDSDMDSEEDVCERLKESPAKILNVENTAAEQVKRKRGRPRLFPPKEPLEAEKVVRKRGRPRKCPVKEMSAEESEPKRCCVETDQPKEIVESSKEKSDVADGQKLTSGVSQPSETCSSVGPKKVVKPKQKISKLKSNVLRQMKLKQIMFQSDKPGSNICCSSDYAVERNNAMEAKVEIRSDRLSAETNNSQQDGVLNDNGEKMFRSNKPGNTFFSNNGCDVNRNDLIEANLVTKNNRLSVDINKEKLARDPDKRITVVQDIIIRAGHQTNNAVGFNLEASSSRNGGQNVPKKCGRPKKSCDILSQIMGDMDKDRPRVAPKKSVVPKKLLPQGLDDKQWRKGILDIAEITHNKDVEVKENPNFLGPDSKTDSGILNKGIEMPDKIKFLLKKLMKASNEDEVPDHVVTEFKKLQVDIIVDVVIREVAQDIIDKPDTKHCPAPLMTKTQRIYLTLMLKLEQQKVEQLIDTFLGRAQHYIFRRGCGLKAAIPLTRLIIGVCRIRADIHTMRMFCCDAFFFIGDMAVPLLFTVLTSWIDVIPMEADVKNYPIAKVLVQLVHLKTFNKPGYNLFPLRLLLSQFYGYPKERLNCDTLFEEVFHEYLRNPSPSTDLPIRLFCRNKDTKWVYKKINEFFIPLIYKIPTENENFKATTVLLLGKICRQFRVKEEHDRACLVELNRFFAGLLEDDVTDLVKQSVSLTLDRLPKERIKIRKEEKQGDSKVPANERSRIVRKNMTKVLPNSNWGYQNNKTLKKGFPKRISKKKAPRKGTSTKVSTGQ